MGNLDDEQVLRDHYGGRAQDYEQVYHRDDPIRQEELGQLTSAIEQLFLGHRVLEVACGTGYWTEGLAVVAEHVTAFDVSPEMLNEAQSKGLPPETVEITEGDAYELEIIEGEFDAGLVMFWLSHVPRRRLEEFLRSLGERLGPGAQVFMADNVYVPGLGGELVEEPDSEDTYKRRESVQGEEELVLKNYFDEAGLRRLLKPYARDLELTFGQNYWWAAYRVRAPGHA